MILNLTTPVLSQGTFTESQVVSAILAQRPVTRYSAAEVRRIVVRTLYWCDVFGVNADIVFAQMIHETDWFRFTGDVGFGQHNFAGLGATGGVPGHSFPLENGLITDDGIDAGVLAVVAHHAVYRWGRRENWPAHLRQYAGEHVDPRYDEALSTKNAGKMIILNDYRGTWAVPGKTYPESLILRSRQIDVFPRGKDPMPISGLIDIRDKLQTASGANRGPLRTIPMAQKRGVVVHYRGVVTTPKPGYATFQQDAAYHVNKDWGQGDLGDGIQYHIGIGWDGDAYLMRDLNRVLWHCGAWPQNENTLAIQLPMGGTQRATPAMLATLRRVVDEWLTFTRAPRSEVWGHQELSGTSCPGTLMSDFVYPYRNREDKLLADGHYFGETKHYVGGGFWRFWQEHGGLPIFGYPLTDERDELCEDGKTHTVQYFERAVFEYHPDNDPPYDILLRRLGAEALKDKEVA